MNNRLSKTDFFKYINEIDINNPIEGFDEIDSLISKLENRYAAGYLSLYYENLTKIDHDLEDVIGNINKTQNYLIWNKA